LQTGGGSDLYFLQDRLSNVISLANSSGGVVEQESYEPFGNTTGSAFTEYGYIGERLDPDAHLMILNARFYDPVQQRFATEDPIGTAGGLNVFAYSDNDPINAFDPSGMNFTDDLLYYSAQGFAAAGDKVSFGFTNWVRDKMGTNDVIDKCSLGYQIGGYVGDTVLYSIMALSLVGPLAEAGSAAVEGVEAAEALETEAGLAEEVGTAAAEEGTPITQEGLDAVESHLDSIDALDHPPNQAMLDNLRSLMGEGENATGPYENFYQHELEEAEGMSQGLSQETAHQMALEGLGHSPYSVYSPEVIEQFPEFFNSNWRAFWGLQ